MKIRIMIAMVVSFVLSDFDGRRSYDRFHPNYYLLFRDCRKKAKTL